MPDLRNCRGWPRRVRDDGRLDAARGENPRREARAVSKISVILSHFHTLSVISQSSGP